MKKFYEFKKKHKIIEIKNSNLHGQGVFALYDIPKGITIEKCPYIVIDDDDLKESNRLQDYIFTSPATKGDYLCVFGYGMMYNHSSNPNVEWEICKKDLRFVNFVTLCSICKGEEILHDYGDDYWKTRD